MGRLGFDLATAIRTTNVILFLQWRCHANQVAAVKNYPVHAKSDRLLQRFRYPFATMSSDHASTSTSIRLPIMSRKNKLSDGRHENPSILSDTLVKRSCLLPIPETERAHRFSHSEPWNQTRTRGIQKRYRSRMPVIREAKFEKLLTEPRNPEATFRGKVNRIPFYGSVLARGESGWKTGPRTRNRLMSLLPPRRSNEQEVVPFSMLEGIDKILEL